MYNCTYPAEFCFIMYLEGGRGLGRWCRLYPFSSKWNGYAAMQCRSLLLALGFGVINFGELRRDEGHQYPCPIASPSYCDG